MKAPDRKTVSELEDLPNIGKAISKDLYLIGIDHSQKLIGKNMLQLYGLLCNKKGQRIDHCVIDVFMSVIIWKVENHSLGGHLQKSES